jgi:acetolactate synthase-1/2/3 large subunit
VKGSDYIARFLTSIGARHVFTVTGGACAHLVDSIAATQGLELVCVQHEQAGAMAADCYSRFEDSIGVTVVTSGPGATNLITGIACAWFDSIPVLHISGQVNTFEQKNDLRIRQMGFQETDIISMVSTITKFARKVDKPEELRAVLEEAVYMAHEGRGGPVLVDIPFDVQTAEVDPESLPAFQPPAPAAEGDHGARYDLICERLQTSGRPVLLVGGGTKLADGRAEFLALAEDLQVPIVATWSGVDVVPSDHPLYRGQVGVYGSRAANFVVQNCDLLISVGSRLDSRITGGKYNSFARDAFRVVVDIDEGELFKGRVEADLPLKMDARRFCVDLRKWLSTKPATSSTEWLLLTKRWMDELANYDRKAAVAGFVDPYDFFEVLAEVAPRDAVLVTDCGANLTWTIQGFAPKGSQRVISAFGNSPMGYSMAASMGAHFANPERPIMCVIGDGGLQMNIQDLQTIRHYAIPLKLFILNNRGYGIIKQFQDLYLDGRHVATGEGYSCPDFADIAKAYGMGYERLTDLSDAGGMLERVLASEGPTIVDVWLTDDQKIEPKLGWGKPIEDQLPLMPRDAFSRYMLIDPFDDVSTATNEIN